MRVAGWLLTALLACWLWPTRFGGSAELLVVSGDSMRPTMEHGDLLVVRRQDRYHVGDAVAFTVPDGPAAGMRIVHRIVAIDPAGGLVTRGDNRTTDDAFETTLDDVIGTVALRVPHGGTALFLLSRWWTLGIVAGALAALHWWPGQRSVAGAGSQTR